MSSPFPHVWDLFQGRSLTHYPIDDRVNGLTEEQAQLRETVFNFCQKVVLHHQLFSVTSGQNASIEIWRMAHPVKIRSYFLFSGASTPCSSNWQSRWLPRPQELLEEVGRHGPPGDHSQPRLWRLRHGFPGPRHCHGGDQQGEWSCCPQLWGS